MCEKFFCVFFNGAQYIYIYIYIYIYNWAEKSLWLTPPLRSSNWSLCNKLSHSCGVTRSWENKLIRHVVCAGIPAREKLIPRMVSLNKM